MALRSKVVDFGRPDLLNEPDQVGGIGHVAVVQEKRYIAVMGVFVEMIDTRGVERRRAAFDAVHGVAKTKQILGEIRSILPRNARDKRDATLGLVLHVYSNNAGGYHKKQ